MTFFALLAVVSIGDDILAIDYLGTGEHEDMSRLSRRLYLCCLDDPETARHHLPESACRATQFNVEHLVIPMKFMRFWPRAGTLEDKQRWLQLRLEFGYNIRQLHINLAAA